MFKTFDSDRYYIERKYHDPDGEFNPYARMKYHGTGYDEQSGQDDEQISAGLNELYSEIKNLPHPVAKAKAVKYVLEHERIYVNEHDYFIGAYSLNRLADAVTFDKWNGEATAERPERIKRLERDFNESGAVAVWPDYDHVVPDWDSLLRLGLKGVMARAAEYKERRVRFGALTEEQKAFFDGIETEYGAIVDFIDRAYRLALSKEHLKAPKIAACLKQLRDGAPTNIYEAMQLIYIYFITSECIDHYQVRSLGNGLDGTLYGFYKRDLESGRFTREEIKELLAYFLMQWSAIGNYWGQPFYMRGSRADGSCKINDLSYDIIEVYDRLGIYNPKIQIKYNENLPPDFLNKILDMIRRGQNCFVFCCEPAMIKAVMSYGATYEEALNMDIRGCYETGVKANEVSAAAAYVNAAKAAEYVFSNGFDRRCGRQIGIKTGEIDELETFEDFYRAVLRQWEYLIESALEIGNEYDKRFAYVNPSSLYSATVETSLKNASDGYGGGVKFNNSSVLNCGFAGLVDSIMAVKKFVYDNKEVTLSTLKAALEADWKGFEKLKAKLKNCPYKYGNGEEETDTYAEMLARYFANKVNNRPNGRGGVYKAVMHSAMQFVWQGEKTLATPDGRGAGEELSKNASPVPGADRKGVTALINSAVRLNPSLYSESFCVDVMLHPSAVEGDDGLAAMKALSDVYLKNGGMSIQINVFDSDVLRKAQENPDKYENLQVRVCGWNVLWNNLSKAEQDAYILR
ncbi:MAG: pyruvate formate lyase family protein, partial [Candidatus Neoclostridium sp.]